jgi:lysyl-tRNA synthetase class 2
VDKNQDSWRPSASLEALQQRAQMLARVRQYFASHDVLEVETPLLASATIPDPNIPSFSLETTNGCSPPHKRHLYLNTSPEFAMKRLLAAGSGPIYQVCKAFRQGEQGSLHNPEFTLLEWYRPGYDHHRLMEEVADLVITLAKDYRSFKGEERITYGQCFQQYLGVDPYVTDVAHLQKVARDEGLGDIPGLTDTDRDGWLDLLMGHCIQPRLGKDQLTFVYDYPASQAALAQVTPGTPSVAERFELFVDGVELANGFHELQDMEEQQRRFEINLMQRKTLGLKPVAIDHYFLDALTSGIPDCAGVALGLDRLQLALVGASRLEQVIAFPFNRI